MLDYDDLEMLERYALATNTAERRQLLSASSTPGAAVVKPGQAFLAGLFALECGDLATARDQVKCLKSLAPHSDYFRRLEALVALRGWNENPDITCKYLEESFGLNFHAPPPAAALGEGRDASQTSPSQAASQSAAAQGHQSTLDPSLYSDSAILNKAIKISRGPAAAGLPDGGTLPKLLSRAGMAAALSYDQDYGLDLSLDERLQLFGLAGSDGNPAFGTLSDQSLAKLVSGSPMLTKLASDAARAERGGAFEFLLTYMTVEQVDELLIIMPIGAAASPALLAAVVRKMYGAQGAVSGIAAAVDAGYGDAAAATSHTTPLMTAAEADSMRRRVLQLCEQLRARGAAGDQGRLAWLEARALLPLAEAAVQRAVVADASVATAIMGGASDVASAQLAAADATSEAESLVARLLSCLEVQGIPAGNYGPLLARQPGPASPPPPSVDLGPALPPLLPNTGLIVRKLLYALVQISSNPPALFSAGGALAGMLDPASQARLLSEVMLTRWSPLAGASPVDWAAAYRDTGGNLALLSEAVELQVSGTSPTGSAAGWEAPSDDVALVITHKGVKHISVLVYDISTEAYYKEKGEEVGMGINLEGLGATFQVEIDLPPALSPQHRFRRLVPLPQLKGRRGVWVVDVQGGGLQSRALLRRGSLAAVVRSSAAGMALTLFREDGTPVTEPRVCVDGRMYTPDKSGAASDNTAAAAVTSSASREVLVPYRAAEPRTTVVVLVDGEGTADGSSIGGFASLMTMQHAIEQYELRCGMRLELESAAAGGRGGTAPLLLQPHLTIGGWTAPLELLQDVSVTVEVQDFDCVVGGGTGGGSSRQVFQDWNPGNGLQASVIQVRLPDRPGRISAVLKARVRRLALGSDGEPDYQDFHVEESWSVNQSDLCTHEVRDLHMTRGSAGNYLLRLLGKAGEPHGGVHVVVALTHAFSAPDEPPMEATEWAPPPPGVSRGSEIDSGAAAGLVIRQELTTDANGTIDLGHLIGITAVAASLEIIESNPAFSGGSAGAKKRRRYVWPLPLRKNLVIGEPNGAGTHMVFRALASSPTDPSHVQCTIPCVGTGGGGVLGPDVNVSGEAAAQLLQPELHRKLGVVLVSLAGAAAFRSMDVKARGSSPSTPEPAVAVVLDKSFTCCDVTERLELRHVTVRQGHIEVAGLPPGLYGLYVSRLELFVTVLVYCGVVVSPAALATPDVAEEAAQDVDVSSRGDTAAAFVFQRGLVAPLSEPQPLQITELRASETEGVTARLAGSKEQLSAAVVVVILSRFEPHYGWQSYLPHLGKPGLSARAGSSFGAPLEGGYQSGRRQGDEVRYVLERRRLVAEGRVRPTPALVDRPSLLVQPWKIRETATSTRSAQRGEAFRDIVCGSALPSSQMCMLAGDGASARGCEWAGAAMAPEAIGCTLYGAAPPRVTQEAAGTLGLAFCPPAVVFANVPVSPDGTVTLRPEQLTAAVADVVRPTGMRISANDPWVAAGHRLVRLIAYTAPAGISAGDFGTRVYREDCVAVEAAPSPSWSDPRVLTALQRPFPAGSSCVERRSCHALQPGNDLVIADAASAKLQLYGTVQKVWALYGSLLSLSPWDPANPYHNSSDAALWSKFSYVGGWSSLTSSSKMERYSQLACRELAFFCYCHDPAFFEEFVLPCLRSRLPSSRCLLDSWLAGIRGRELIDTWDVPHRYARLTPLERILLAWEEDLVEASAATAGSVQPGATVILPRLGRLAADMRARVRRRSVQRGLAASIAEVKRRRFEIALNGPGDQSNVSNQTQQLTETSFEEVSATSFMRDAVIGSAGMPRLAAAMQPPPGYGGLNSGMVAAAPAAIGAKNLDMSRRSRMLARVQDYNTPPATQEWAEACWYQKPPSLQTDPNSISPESEFWADLAEHLSRGGVMGSAATTSGPAGAVFLPHSLEAGGWSFSDALLATAVVGVPWADTTPLSVTQGTRLVITAATPTIAYVRQTAAGPGLAKETADLGGGSSGIDDVAGDVESTSGQAQQTQRQGILIIQRLLDPNLDHHAEVKQQRTPAPGVDGGPGAFPDEVVEDCSDLEGVELPNGSQLLFDRLYCYTAVVSNTGPKNVRVDVAMQAPQGAVALGGRPALWVHSTELPSYGVCKLPLYYFYFPRPSAPSEVQNNSVSFDAFPASVSFQGQIFTTSTDQTASLQVLHRSLTSPGDDLGSTPLANWSWSRLAALPGTPEADAARLKYLEEAGDLSAGLDLSLVLWRCHEKAFWELAITILRQRHVWHQRIWSYAVFHREEQALKELLHSMEPLMDWLGAEAPAAGQLINSAPGNNPSAETLLKPSWLSADRTPHLEYWPLVNSRAHPLGGRRATLNIALEQSWRTLLRRMSAVAAAGQENTTEDLLAAAYYLILQDRPMEASFVMDRITMGQNSSDLDPLRGAAPDLGSTEQELQLCYLRAWLVLADTSASSQKLKSAAESLRRFRPSVASADSSGLASMSNTSGAGRILEPRWQSRLQTMIDALEEASSAAALLQQAAGAEQTGEMLQATADTTESAGENYQPDLLLYESQEGPHGTVLLEVPKTVQKVILAAHFMDLELLFSISPFDKTLLGDSNKGGHNSVGVGHGASSFLQPAWSTTLDLQDVGRASQLAANDGTDIPAVFCTLKTDQVGANEVLKFLIQPFSIMQQQRQPTSSTATTNNRISHGAMLLEAIGISNGSSSSGVGGAMGPLHKALACCHCELRVVVRREQGVIQVLNSKTGAPVDSAYVKVYTMAKGSNVAAFHKDGYTDRRGLMDFWSLTTTPDHQRIVSVAILVSHPELGSKVQHITPPLK